MSEETKNIVRNILKETLRAEIHFKQLRSKFQQYQSELYLLISRGNKDILIYSDLK